MSNSAEFLVELEENDALIAMQKCIDSFSDLIIKIDHDPQTYTAKIKKSENHKVYIETPFEEKLKTINDSVSIKFFIGTEVFFIKTPIEALDEQLCFSDKAKIIQLKRRKEERHNIPDGWPQLAAIWSIQQKIKNDAVVIDISYSGIRFEIPQLTLPVEKGDIIRIQFKVNKRSEVVCDAKVRFKLKKPNGSHIFGMEFGRIQDSQKSRVRSVVDDIIAHNALKQQI
ncbi:MAG: PilZ domain-containing protein [Pseudobdellovibrio sp.]